MLKKIDELAKLSSKNRDRSPISISFQNSRKSRAKSFAYLAMIEDPNIAGDAVDALKAKSRADTHFVFCCLLDSIRELRGR